MNVPAEDVHALQSLAYDHAARPNFELLKYCLVWPDERPSVRLSSEASEFLSDLWIVRGFIHRALPRWQWGLDPQYFQDVWVAGLQTVPDWPGFKRLQLTESDRMYLADCLKVGLSDL